MSKLNILSNLSILTKLIYARTMSDFPHEEQYGLTSQLRRSIVSVRVNIREGNTFKDFNKGRFFKIARGSLEEVDECMIIANELGYLSDLYFEDYRKKYWLCLNMLNKLISSISSD